jgi:ankyrin repeat protein
MDNQEPRMKKQKLESNQVQMSLIQLIAKMSQIPNRLRMNLEQNKIKDIIKQKKFNKDETTENGLTPLMVAIEIKSTVLALELIKSGMSNPSAASDENDTALILACSNNFTNIASALIKTGESKPETQNKSRNTALIYASYNKMEQIVSELISTGQSNPGAVNDEGDTALITACVEIHNIISLEIIKTGQSNPGAVNSDGETALHYACNNKMSDVALELIKTGESNPGAVNSEGDTALLYACSKGLSDVSLELIKTGQTNPGEVDKKRFTALMYACYKKMTEVALELIKTTQSNTEFQGASGLTSLIVACVNEMPDVALEIIKTGKSNPGVENDNGATALMIACFKNMPNVAIEILKTGESNPQAVSIRGETALETAMSNNMGEVVTLIKNELYKYAININEDGYNFVTMDTLKIQDYLKDNIGNLCFRIDNHNYFTNKKILIKQLNDAANIKYACIEAGYNNPAEAEYRFTSDNNIIYDQEYLSLSSVFGLQIVVEKEEIEKLTENPYSSQLYNVIHTGVKLGTIISYAYINNAYGASADHCQPGKETDVYTLVPGTAICTGDNSANEKENEVQSSNESIIIKIQYKTEILEFKIDDINNITIGEIKKMLLDKLKINQNVKFIYKGKVYATDEMKLIEIEGNPNGMTLQSSVSPIVGGRKTKKIQKIIRKIKTQKTIIKLKKENQKKKTQKKKM